MPHDYEPKQLKLKKSDIKVKSRRGLTALASKDRIEVYMLTWTHHQQKEIFVMTDCPVKPHIMEWYNQHMGYIKNSDCTANSYLMSQLLSSGT